MSYHYFLIDVFTTQPFGGNPLAVFPCASGLSGREMQLIARELNLSETAFVLPSESECATHHVRIFTPAKELPFAGHPTIGTAIVLAAMSNQGSIVKPIDLLFEEGVGEVPIQVTRGSDGGYHATLEVGAARISEDVPAVEDLARILNIGSNQILTESVRPAIVSCGVPFTMIPLKSLQSLSDVSLNMSAWDDLLSSSQAPQVYPYFVDLAKNEAHVRMFAPAFGQPEDAATGAAAMALGSYLTMRTGSVSVQEWHVHQGAQIGRRSFLRVRVDPSERAFCGVELCGSGVLIGRGEIYENLFSSSTPVQAALRANHA